MLFGHTYDIRIRAELSDGQIVKAKVPIEARFVTRDELIKKIKSLFENEISFTYNGLSVNKYLELYDANE